jgi:hypothetical protein
MALGELSKQRADLDGLQSKFCILILKTWFWYLRWVGDVINGFVDSSGLSILV